ncbi:hypothetical protein UlMin_006169 [Ulmus minor]
MEFPYIFSQKKIRMSFENKICGLLSFQTNFTSASSFILSKKGILLRRSETLNLTGFCDADWENDLHDRRSTTGFCIYLGRNVVSWSSKKQPVVSRSSTKVEYRSLANATSELIWL